MSNLWGWFKRLGIAIVGTISFSVNSAIAEIAEDTTLPTNSIINKQSNILIEGGTQVGSNLFHSFKEFSIDNGTTAEFKNADSVQNIISRVTGKSVSHIDGTIKAQYAANLFLINPNGIIFGPNASLNIGGSFIATTASSLNFANGTQFSATDPQIPPLLTVSVPIGLQFGITAAPIRNQSSHQVQLRLNGISFSRTVGLQVKPGKTLALVGGDLLFEGGNLTAESGQIELGSVASNSLIRLKSINQGWTLGYEDTQDFQNIRFMGRTVNNSEIPSQVNAGNTDGSGGNIQVQANTVELTGYRALLTTQTTGVGDGGYLMINSGKLIVRDGAQVFTSSSGKGRGGNLTVNASESVDLIGNINLPNSTGLLSTTIASGQAGDLTINTGKLRIQDGAEVSAGSTGIIDQKNFIPATGKGGNLNIIASKSVELIGTGAKGSPSSLLARTLGSGDAGQVTITTGKLIIQRGAEVNVSSKFDTNYIYPENTRLGKAGELYVTANSIQLENKGKLISNSESGQGGNITLQVRDLLLMRLDSQISTNSGKLGTGGNGGNIKIDAPNGLIFAVPLNNSDITANAFFGSGGQITINADSIFGFVQRDRANLANILNTNKPEELNPNRVPTNDITAFSQENPSLSGSVEINSPDIDPSQGLVELPQNVVDASRQIVAGCNAGKTARASLTTIGRGGIESSPTDSLMSDAVLADWISPETLDENRVSKSPTTQAMLPKVKSTNAPTPIVEAQGWVLDSNGNVVLVAQAPTTIPHSPALNPASCALVRK